MKTRLFLICVISSVLALIMVFGVVAAGQKYSQEARFDQTFHLSRITEDDNRLDSLAIGLVTEVGGLADKGWSWLSYQGLLQAEIDFGVVGTVYTPTNPAGYEYKLQQCVNEGNELCISVGFTMADATMNVATNNPGTKFAILDYGWESYPGNLRGVHFAEDEVGYMAGTLAGLMTESDVVGDIGGPSYVSAVVSLVEGYRNGAQCANPAVNVFLKYTDAFDDPSLGAAVAQEMIAQDADVIFAAAGQTGWGSVITATQSGVWGIGVDMDMYLNVFEEGGLEGSDKLLSSAMKRLDNAVYATISDVVYQTFTPGPALYDLGDDGVGLAPYHETDSFVSQDVRDALESVRLGIINQTIDVSDPCRESDIGLVFEEGGLADKGWNWLGYQGLLRAEIDFGVVGTVYTPTNPAGYEYKLQQCVNEGNELCISVGFTMADATMNVATNNPGTKFAILDYGWESYPGNLRGVHFAEDEVGYMAGTLAGLMTESDVVGDIGGPSYVSAVVSLVEGYRNGAQCANPAVNVFLKYTDAFDDPSLGAAVAQEMIAQDADVIFAAAGQTGWGSVITATQSGVWGIGVDMDMYLNVFEEGGLEGSDKLLSSAMKRLDNAVYATISDVVYQTFTPGPALYDLGDDGVGLAPYHETDSFVSQDVRDALESVRLGIINQTIDVSDPCRKYIYLPLIFKQ